MGVVPKKTKAEYYIFRHISVIKIVGFIMTLAAASQIGDIFINDKLKTPFIIFCSIEFFILSGGSPSDPTKSFAAAWLDWLKYSFAKNKLYSEKSEENKHEDDIIETKIENDSNIE